MFDFFYYFLLNFLVQRKTFAFFQFKLHELFLLYFFLDGLSFELVKLECLGWGWLEEIERVALSNLSLFSMFYFSINNRISRFEVKVSESIVKSTIEGPKIQLFCFNWWLIFNLIYLSVCIRNSFSNWSSNIETKEVLLVNHWLRNNFFNSLYLYLLFYLLKRQLLFLLIKLTCEFQPTSFLLWFGFFPFLHMFLVDKYIKFTFLFEKHRQWLFTHAFKLRDAKRGPPKSDFSCY